MVKIWHKGSSIDKKIEEFTVGDDFIIDQELVQYDCEASIAHAKMLKKIGILSASEEKHLIEELQKISKIIKKENLLFRLRMKIVIQPLKID